jgi:hypothetical protein
VLRRRGARGTIALRGTFTVRSAAEAFAAAQGVAVRVRNGSAVDEQRAWRPDECRTAKSGHITCAAAGKSARARFVPAAGGVYRLRITLAKAAISPTFDASVGVVLTHGAAIDRAGTLAAASCKQRSAQLRCRQ